MNRPGFRILGLNYPPEYANALTTLRRTAPIIPNLSSKLALVNGSNRFSVDASESSGIRDLPQALAFPQWPEAVRFRVRKGRFISCDSRSLFQTCHGRNDISKYR